METIHSNLKKIILGILVICIFYAKYTLAQNGVGINTSSPKSNFEVNGSMGQKVNTVTASTSLDDNYNTIICNNTGGEITISLPDVSICTGRVYTIKRSNYEKTSQNMYQ